MSPTEIRVPSMLGGATGTSRDMSRQSADGGAPQRPGEQPGTPRPRPHQCSFLVCDFSLATKGAPCLFRSALEPPIPAYLCSLSPKYARAVVMIPSAYTPERVDVYIEVPISSVRMIPHLAANGILNSSGAFLFASFLAGTIPTDGDRAALLKPTTQMLDVARETIGRTIQTAETNYWGFCVCPTRLDAAFLGILDEFDIRKSEVAHSGFVPFQAGSVVQEHQSILDEPFGDIVKEVSDSIGLSDSVRVPPPVMQICEWSFNATNSLFTHRTYTCLRRLVDQESRRHQAGLESRTDLRGYLEHLSEVEDSIYETLQKEFLYGLSAVGSVLRISQSKNKYMAESLMMQTGLVQFSAFGRESPYALVDLGEASSQRTPEQLVAEQFERFQRREKRFQECHAALQNCLRFDSMFHTISLKYTMKVIPEAEAFAMTLGSIKDNNIGLLLKSLHRLFAFLEETALSGVGGVPFYNIGAVLDDLREDLLLVLAEFSDCIPPLCNASLIRLFLGSQLAAEIKDKPPKHVVSLVTTAIANEELPRSKAENLERLLEILADGKKKRSELAHNKDLTKALLARGYRVRVAYFFTTLNQFFIEHVMSVVICMAYEEYIRSRTTATSAWLKGAPSFQEGDQRCWDLSIYMAFARHFATHCQDTYTSCILHWYSVLTDGCDVISNHHEYTMESLQTLVSSSVSGMWQSLEGIGLHATKEDDDSLATILRVDMDFVPQLAESGLCFKGITTQPLPGVYVDSLKRLFFCIVDSASSIRLVIDEFYQRYIAPGILPRDDIEFLSLDAGRKEYESMVAALEKTITKPLGKHVYLYDAPKDLAVEEVETEKKRTFRRRLNIFSSEPCNTSTEPIINVDVEGMKPSALGELLRLEFPDKLAKEHLAKYDSLPQSQQDEIYKAVIELKDIRMKSQQLIAKFQHRHATEEFIACTIKKEYLTSNALIEACFNECDYRVSIAPSGEPIKRLFSEIIDGLVDIIRLACDILMEEAPLATFMNCASKTILSHSLPALDEPRANILPPSSILDVDMNQYQCQFLVSRAVPQGDTYEFQMEEEIRDVSDEDILQMTQLSRRHGDDNYVLPALLNIVDIEYLLRRNPSFLSKMIHNAGNLLTQMDDFVSENLVVLPNFIANALARFNLIQFKRVTLDVLKRIRGNVLDHVHGILSRTTQFSLDVAIATERIMCKSPVSPDELGVVVQSLQCYEGFAKSWVAVITLFIDLIVDVRFIDTSYIQFYVPPTYVPCNVFEYDSFAALYFDRRHLLGAGGEENESEKDVAEPGPGGLEDYSTYGIPEFMRSISRIVIRQRMALHTAKVQTRIFARHLLKFSDWLSDVAVIFQKYCKDMLCLDLIGLCQARFSPHTFMSRYGQLTKDMSLPFLDDNYEILDDELVHEFLDSIQAYVPNFLLLRTPEESQRVREGKNVTRTSIRDMAANLDAEIRQSISFPLQYLRPGKDQLAPDANTVPMEMHEVFGLSTDGKRLETLSESDTKREMELLNILIVASSDPEGMYPKIPFEQPQLIEGSLQLSDLKSPILPYYDIYSAFRELLFVGIVLNRLYKVAERWAKQLEITLNLAENPVSTIEIVRPMVILLMSLFSLRRSFVACQARQLGHTDLDSFMRLINNTTEIILSMRKLPLFHSWVHILSLTETTIVDIGPKILYLQYLKENVFIDAEARRISEEIDIPVDEAKSLENRVLLGALKNEASFTVARKVHRGMMRSCEVETQLAVIETFLDGIQIYRCTLTVYLDLSQELSAITTKWQNRTERRDGLAEDVTQPVKLTLPNLEALRRRRSKSIVMRNRLSGAGSRGEFHRSFDEDGLGTERRRLILENVQRPESQISGMISVNSEGDGHSEASADHSSRAMGNTIMATQLFSFRTPKTVLPFLRVDEETLGQVRDALIVVADILSREYPLVIQKRARMIETQILLIRSVLIALRRLPMLLPEVLHLVPHLTVGHEGQQNVAFVKLYKEFGEFRRSIYGMLNSLHDLNRAIGSSPSMPLRKLLKLKPHILTQLAGMTFDLQKVLLAVYQHVFQNALIPYQSSRPVPCALLLPKIPSVYYNTFSIEDKLNLLYKCSSVSMAVIPNIDRLLTGEPQNMTLLEVESNASYGNPGRQLRASDIIFTGLESGFECLYFNYGIPAPKELHLISGTINDIRILRESLLREYKRAIILLLSGRLLELLTQCLYQAIFYALSTAFSLFLDGSVDNFFSLKFDLFDRLKKIILDSEIHDYLEEKVDYQILQPHYRVPVKFFSGFKQTVSSTGDSSNTINDDVVRSMAQVCYYQHRRYQRYFFFKAVAARIFEYDNLLNGIIASTVGFYNNCVVRLENDNSTPPEQRQFRTKNSAPRLEPFELPPAGSGNAETVQRLRQIFEMVYGNTYYSTETMTMGYSLNANVNTILSLLPFGLITSGVILDTGASELSGKLIREKCPSNKPPTEVLPIFDSQKEEGQGVDGTSAEDGDMGSTYGLSLQSLCRQFKVSSSSAVTDVRGHYLGKATILDAIALNYKQLMVCSKIIIGAIQRKPIFVYSDKIRGYNIIDLKLIAQYTSRLMGTRHVILSLSNYLSEDSMIRKIISYLLAGYGVYLQGVELLTNAHHSRLTDLFNTIYFAQGSLPVIQYQNGEGVPGSIALNDFSHYLLTGYIVVFLPELLHRDDGSFQMSEVGSVVGQLGGQLKLEVYLDSFGTALTTSVAKLNILVSSSLANLTIHTSLGGSEKCMTNERRELPTGEKRNKVMTQLYRDLLADFVGLPNFAPMMLRLHTQIHIDRDTLSLVQSNYILHYLFLKKSEAFGEMLYSVALMLNFMHNFCPKLHPDDVDIIFKRTRDKQNFFSLAITTSLLLVSQTLYLNVREFIVQIVSASFKLSSVQRSHIQRIVTGLSKLMGLSHEHVSLKKSRVQTLKAAISNMGGQMNDRMDGLGPQTIPMGTEQQGQPTAPGPDTGDEFVIDYTRNTSASLCQNVWGYIRQTLAPQYVKTCEQIAEQSEFLEPLGADIILTCLDYLYFGPCLMCSRRQSIQFLTNLALFVARVGRLTPIYIHSIEDLHNNGETIRVLGGTGLVIMVLEEITGNLSMSLYSAILAFLNPIPRISLTHDVDLECEMAGTYRSGDVNGTVVTRYGRPKLLILTSGNHPIEQFIQTPLGLVPKCISVESSILRTPALVRTLILMPLGFRPNVTHSRFDGITKKITDFTLDDIVDIHTAKAYFRLKCTPHTEGLEKEVSSGRRRLHLASTLFYVACLQYLEQMTAVFSMCLDYRSWRLIRACLFYSLTQFGICRYMPPTPAAFDPNATDDIPPALQQAPHGDGEAQRSPVQVSFMAQIGGLTSAARAMTQSVTNYLSDNEGNIHYIIPGMLRLSQIWCGEHIGNYEPPLANMTRHRSDFFSVDFTDEFLMLNVYRAKSGKEVCLNILYPLFAAAWNSASLVYLCANSEHKPKTLRKVWNKYLAYHSKYSIPTIISRFSNEKEFKKSVEDAIVEMEARLPTEYPYERYKYCYLCMVDEKDQFFRFGGQPVSTKSSDLKMGNDGYLNTGCIGDLRAVSLVKLSMIERSALHGARPSPKIAFVPYMYGSHIMNNEHVQRYLTPMAIHELARYFDMNRSHTIFFIAVCMLASVPFHVIGPRYSGKTTLVMAAHHLLCDYVDKRTFVPSTCEPNVNFLNDVANSLYLSRKNALVYPGPRLLHMHMMMLPLDNGRFAKYKEEELTIITRRSILDVLGLFLSEKVVLLHSPWNNCISPEMDGHQLLLGTVMAQTLSISLESEFVPPQLASSQFIEINVNLPTRTFLVDLLARQRSYLKFLPFLITNVVNHRASIATNSLPTCPPPAESGEIDELHEQNEFGLPWIRQIVDGVLLVKDEIPFSLLRLFAEVRRLLLFCDMVTGSDIQLCTFSASSILLALRAIPDITAATMFSIIDALRGSLAMGCLNSVGPWGLLENSNLQSFLAKNKLFAQFNVNDLQMEPTWEQESLATAQEICNVLSDSEDSSADEDIQAIENTRSSVLRAKSNLKDPPQILGRASVSSMGNTGPKQPRKQRQSSLLGFLRVLEAAPLFDGIPLLREQKDISGSSSVYVIDGAMYSRYLTAYKRYIVGVIPPNVANKIFMQYVLIRYELEFRSIHVQTMLESLQNPDRFRRIHGGSVLRHYNTLELGIVSMLMRKKDLNIPLSHLLILLATFGNYKIYGIRAFEKLLRYTHVKDLENQGIETKKQGAEIRLPDLQLYPTFNLEGIDVDLADKAAMSSAATTPTFEYEMITHRLLLDIDLLLMQYNLQTTSDVAAADMTVDVSAMHQVGNKYKAPQTPNLLLDNFMRELTRIVGRMGEVYFTYYFLRGIFCLALQLDPIIALRPLTFINAVQFCTSIGSVNPDMLSRTATDYQLTEFCRAFGIDSPHDLWIKSTYKMLVTVSLAHLMHVDAVHVTHGISTLAHAGNYSLRLFTPAERSILCFLTSFRSNFDIIIDVRNLLNLASRNMAMIIFCDIPTPSGMKLSELPMIRHLVTDVTSFPAKRTTTGEGESTMHFHSRLVNVYITKTRMVPKRIVASMPQFLLASICQYYGISRNYFCKSAGFCIDLVGSRKLYHGRPIFPIVSMMEALSAATLHIYLFITGNLIDGAMIISFAKFASFAAQLFEMRVHYYGKLVSSYETLLQTLKLLNNGMYRQMFPPTIRDNIVSYRAKLQALRTSALPYYKRALVLLRNAPCDCPATVARIYASSLRKDIIATETAFETAISQELRTSGFDKFSIVTNTFAGGFADSVFGFVKSGSEILTDTYLRDIEAQISAMILDSDCVYGKDPEVREAKTIQTKGTLSFNPTLFPSSLLGEFLESAPVRWDIAATISLTKDKIYNNISTLQELLTMILAHTLGTRLFFIDGAFVMLFATCTEIHAICTAEAEYEARKGELQGYKDKAGNYVLEKAVAAIYWIDASLSPVAFNRELTKAFAQAKSIGFRNVLVNKSADIYKYADYTSGLQDTDPSVINVRTLTTLFGAVSHAYTEGGKFIRINGTLLNPVRPLHEYRYYIGMAQDTIFTDFTSAGLLNFEAIDNSLLIQPSYTSLNTFLRFLEIHSPDASELTITHTYDFGAEHIKSTLLYASLPFEKMEVTLGNRLLLTSIDFYRLVNRCAEINDTFVVKKYGAELSKTIDNPDVFVHLVDSSTRRSSLTETDTSVDSLCNSPLNFDFGLLECFCNRAMTVAEHWYQLDAEVYSTEHLKDFATCTGRAVSAILIMYKRLSCVMPTLSYLFTNKVFGNWPVYLRERFHEFPQSPIYIIIVNIIFPYMSLRVHRLLPRRWVTQLTSLAALVFSLVLSDCPWEYLQLSRAIMTPCIANKAIVTNPMFNAHVGTYVEARELLRTAPFSFQASPLTNYAWKNISVLFPYASQIKDWLMHFRRTNYMFVSLTTVSEPYALILGHYMQREACRHVQDEPKRRGAERSTKQDRPILNTLPLFTQECYQSISSDVDLSLPTELQMPSYQNLIKSLVFSLTLKEGTLHRSFKHFCMVNRMVNYKQEVEKDEKMIRDAHMAYCRHQQLHPQFLCDILVKIYIQILIACGMTPNLETIGQDSYRYTPEASVIFGRADGFGSRTLILMFDRELNIIDIVVNILERALLAQLGLASYVLTSRPTEDDLRTRTVIVDATIHTQKTIDVLLRLYKHGHVPKNLLILLIPVKKGPLFGEESVRHTISRPPIDDIDASVIRDSTPTENLGYSIAAFSGTSNAACCYLEAPETIQGMMRYLLTLSDRIFRIHSFNYLTLNPVEYRVFFCILLKYAYLKSNRAYEYDDSYYLAAMTHFIHTRNVEKTLLKVRSSLAIYSSQCGYRDVTQDRMLVANAFVASRTVDDSSSGKAGMNTFLINYNRSLNLHLMGQVSVNSFISFDSSLVTLNPALSYTIFYLNLHMMRVMASFPVRLTTSVCLVNAEVRNQFEQNQLAILSIIHGCDTETDLDDLCCTNSESDLSETLSSLSSSASSAISDVLSLRDEVIAIENATAAAQAGLWHGQQMATYTETATLEVTERDLEEILPKKRRMEDYQVTEDINSILLVKRGDTSSALIKILERLTMIQQNVQITSLDPDELSEEDAKKRTLFPDELRKALFAIKYQPFVVANVEADHATKNRYFRELCYYTMSTELFQYLRRQPITSNPFCDAPLLQLEASLPRSLQTIFAMSEGYTQCTRTAMTLFSDVFSDVSQAFIFWSDRYWEIRADVYQPMLGNIFMWASLNVSLRQEAGHNSQFILLPERPTIIQKYRVLASGKLLLEIDKQKKHLTKEAKEQLDPKGFCIKLTGLRLHNIAYDQLLGTVVDQTPESLGGYIQTLTCYAILVDSAYSPIMQSSTRDSFTSLLDYHNSERKHEIRARETAQDDAYSDAESLLNAEDDKTQFIAIPLVLGGVSSGINLYLKNNSTVQNFEFALKGAYCSAGHLY
ncbi:hypothetical protein GMRT_14745 [Giardia muris]|uniref:Uncharacterized protein n=1 Tax=Giardia muris TaxID=5742 RepID=A0A4Z1T8V9_GIAMU|nr:hypothetical protein GMRT_14745 [Giardia muris]|eukprot:TNJ28951.1 hypothetical protein GMRT_14745 [Giardia muris]